MRITEQQFREYQVVQESGACNMVNKDCVKRFAMEADLHGLVDVIDDGNYYVILENYQELEEEYGVVSDDEL